ncbi:hypothetical protein BCV69DRAFT_281624 [Microstroma glucosiphilum]|uniref:Vps72/YL1 C-terminal domain-containing protein n=1 Tax=Pseudomicrostroma glucosiphilum TaxID=1684307 RepID=A0A316UA21_9BASI|nr:hypothetical protein BCV69DRAFT_281624 [Pseudomicrostroma glucosiphilum]PWN21688.1 hypothetical protein BCV69DRAFT_281624 [Pseudomicrostroma glucosiphilum]
MAFLTMYNQHDAPKPFKRVPAYSTSASGRKRNYKQIIALEQEAAFELGGAAGGAAGSKRRKGGKLGAGGKKEAGVMSADGRLLQGAAAKQARRREDRLKKEAEQAAREEAGEDISGTATPTGELTAGGSGDGDESMAEGDADASTITPTEEELEQQRLEEEERKRKRSLPTYLSVEAPPSLRPAKKYCDVTGLIAPYTDPKTSLRYHSAEIYEVIKTFGPGIDQAYLSLRGRGSTLL